MKLKEFLNFLNIDYLIYDEIINHGFLTYSLPASEFFKKNEWIFPLRKLIINPNKFHEISKSIFLKEDQFISENKNKKKFIEFEKFIELL